jgi:hypothetical protein
MKKSVALFAALGLLSSIAVLAAPPKDPKASSKTKTIAVWTCPITGETIKDHATADKKTATYGKYTVHFCCGGCPESFAKLSDKDKKAKVAAAVKKDAEAAKKPAAKS